jgi:hypothetical protein
VVARNRKEGCRPALPDLCRGDNTMTDSVEPRKSIFCFADEGPVPATHGSSLSFDIIASALGIRLLDVSSNDVIRPGKESG